MKEKSRRQFIKSCLFVAFSGFAPSFFSLFSGCKQENKSTPPPHTSDLDKKKRVSLTDTAQIDPEFEPAYLRLHRSGELKKGGRSCGTS